MNTQKTAAMYRCIRWLVKTCYPKMKVEGQRPQAPVILVGDHSQMNRLIPAELYLPGEKRYLVCRGDDASEGSAGVYGRALPQYPQKGLPHQHLKGGSP